MNLCWLAQLVEVAAEVRVYKVRVWPRTRAATAAGSMVMAEIEFTVMAEFGFMAEVEVELKVMAEAELKFMVMVMAKTSLGTKKVLASRKFEIKSSDFQAEALITEEAVPEN